MRAAYGSRFRAEKRRGKGEESGEETAGKAASGGPRTDKRRNARVSVLPSADLPPHTCTMLPPPGKTAEGRAKIGSQSCAEGKQSDAPPLSPIVTGKYLLQALVSGS